MVTNGGTTAGNRLLHVTGSIAPGIYAGVGLYFTSCADFTGYLGFTGRLVGTLGSCDTLGAGVQIPQNSDRASSADPKAQCTGTACYGPKGPLFLGSSGFVSFASMTNGMPLVTVGPEGQSRIIGISVLFHAPSTGCTVDFTLDDLSLLSVRPGAALETFDGGLDTFGLNFYNDGTPSNLALPHDAGGGVATLTWDATLGDPAPGSLRVTAPFSDYNQYVDAVRLYDPNTLLDWTGKHTLWVRVRLDGGTGFNPVDQPGGAQVHVNSFIRGVGGLPDQDNYFSNYDTVWPGSATWVDYSLDLTGLAGKSGWDPAHISSFGVQLNTGAGRAGAAKPTPATFHIDSFWLE